MCAFVWYGTVLTFASHVQMAELWRVRVEDGNGREIYGDSYSDIWAINRLHYKAASPQACDHVSFALHDQVFNNVPWLCVRVCACVCVMYDSKGRFISFNSC